jgi:excisionase family DNA binding protein
MKREGLMDNNIVLTPVPLEQLLEAITEKVIIAIRKQQQEDQQEKLLTTADVCALLHVTPVTINTWIKKGKLEKYSNEGGKNFFKYSEVMESLKTLKKYKVK